MKPNELLVAIINKLIEEDAVITSDTIWDELFEAKLLDAVSFELVVYSLEATTRLRIKDTFYKGSIEKLFGKKVFDFPDEYMEREPSNDPLFTFRTILKTLQSVGWDIADAMREESEEGKTGRTGQST